MFGFSFSELALVGIIFALVVSAGRVGRLGEAVARARSRSRRSDDPGIDVRVVPDERRSRDLSGLPPPFW